MATYTDNYNLRKPLYSETADIDVINDNMDVIDDIMHNSQISLADAYDLNETYNTGDVVMYELLMYRCLEDNVTGAWDGTKWERTTASACGGSGTAEEVSYDNTNSGLTADNVQDAIDELQGEIENIPIVEANPAGTATAELGTIGIDDVIYSLAGGKVYGTSSGAIATFADGGKDKPLKSLKIAINPIQQSGTPSPSNPLPISGWTGANIERCGINLWDEEWEGGAYNNTTGGYQPNASCIRCKNKIKVKPNVSYYMQIGSTSGLNICQYDVNGNYLGVSTLIQCTTSKVITTNVNCEYLAFYCLGTSYNNDISLNSNSTDTEYHAYNGTTYPITWSDAGTVFGGELDVTSGVLTVDRIEWTAQQRTWSTYISVAGYTFYYTATPPETVDVINNTPTNRYYSVSDTFTYYTSPENWWTNAPNCGYVYNVSGVSTSKRVWIRYDGDDFEDVVDGAKFIFMLKTPITYQLTPTEVTTLLGNNNIWSDTGEIKECVYQRDLNIAINELFSLLQNQSGTRSLSALNLTKSASMELTKEEITEETKEEEQNENKR